MSNDVIVVGGGIVGSALAYALATEHRARVTIVDDRRAHSASPASAGILGAQIEATHLPESRRASVFPFMLASRARHAALDAELRDRVGIGSGYERCGLLRVAFDDASVAAVRATFAWQLASGADVAAIDGAEAHALEPSLSRDVRGGVFLQDEGRVDPRRMLHALQLAGNAVGVHCLNRRVRSVIVEGGRALGVETDHYPLWANAVVVAAGSWAGELDAGTSATQVRPVRGQLALVDRPLDGLSRVVFGPTGYVVPRDGGRVALGSTMEHVGFVGGVTVGGLSAIFDGAIRLIPGLANATVDATLCGFRPADDRPRIGRTEIERLFVATGHYRNGVLLAPETAHQLARIIAGDVVDDDALAPFAPDPSTAPLAH